MLELWLLWLIIGPCALLVGLTTYDAVGWTIAGIAMIILGIAGAIKTFLE